MNETSRFSSVLHSRFVSAFYLVHPTDHTDVHYYTICVNIPFGATAHCTCHDPRAVAKKPWKFFRKLLKKGLQYLSWVIITDKLAQYAAAKIFLLHLLIVLPCRADSTSGTKSQIWKERRSTIPSFQIAASFLLLALLFRKTLQRSR